MTNKTVPVNPTREMIAAGQGRSAKPDEYPLDVASVRMIYAAMLAAAPEPLSVEVSPAPVGVVDDAMVERAVKAYWKTHNLVSTSEQDAMLAALQAAALTPAAPVAESVELPPLSMLSIMEGDGIVTAEMIAAVKARDCDGMPISYREIYMVMHKHRPPSPPVAAGLTENDHIALSQALFAMNRCAQEAGADKWKPLIAQLESLVRRLAASPVSGGKGRE